MYAHLEPGIIRPGYVLGIDRANARLRAVIDDYPVDDVRYDPRNPPWPLAQAFFRGGPPWRCLGPIGHRRVLFHDDFLGVSGNASGSSFTNLPLLGDTRWVADGSGGTTITQGADGVGVATFMSESSNSFRLLKHDDALTAPADGHAYHWLVRFSASYTGTPSVVIPPRAGVVGDDIVIGGFGIYVYTEPGSQFQVAGQEGVSETVEGTTFAHDQWYIAEIILTAESIFGWVDGNGPAQPSSLVGSAFPARFWTANNDGSVTGGSRVFNLDYAHASLVSIVTPDNLN